MNKAELEKLVATLQAEIRLRNEAFDEVIDNAGYAPVLEYRGVRISVTTEKRLNEMVDRDSDTSDLKNVGTDPTKVSIGGRLYRIAYIGKESWATPGGSDDEPFDYIEGMIDYDSNITRVRINYKVANRYQAKVDRFGIDAFNTIIGAFMATFNEDKYSSAEVRYVNEVLCFSTAFNIAGVVHKTDGIKSFLSEATRLKNQVDIFVNKL